MKQVRFRALAVAGAMAFALTAFSSPAAAVKLDAGEDMFLNLNVLMQPQLGVTYDGNASDTTADFRIRRMRLLFGGQVSKWFSFFMETDSPNLGSQGRWNGFIVQDAFVSFNLHESFNLAAGMILAPFIHQARQSAVSLHTLDYHVPLIKFPKQGHQIWRDMGVEARGIIAGKLDYRIAITNGVPGTADDIPRFTGRIAYNIFDPEPGFFYGGTYLGKKRVLAIGATFDMQPDALLFDATGQPTGDDYTHYAFGGDLFWDLPLKGDRRVSGQVAFVYYGNDDNPDAGMGVLADIGYAFGVWEPILAVDWFKPEGADDLTGQFLGIHAGLNWWVKGHNANIKLDIGLIKAAGLEFGDASVVTTLQTQMFF